MERFVLLLCNLIIQAIGVPGLNLTDFDVSHEFGLTDDIFSTGGRGRGRGRGRGPAGQHKEIHGAKELRSMLERYIFVRPGGREEDLKAFLIEGRQPPRNPLDDFNSLHTGNIKEIVQLAKNQAFQQDEHLKRLGIDRLEQWEREIEYFAKTGKDYRGKYKFGPKHKQEWIAKHEAKLKKFMQNQNSTSQSDSEKKFGYRRQYSYVVGSVADAIEKRGYKPKDNMFILYNADERLNEIAKNFILQSIYQTRHNLAKTREIRRRYRNDPTYRVAIIWGYIMNYKDKMRRLITTMHNTITPATWVKFYYVLVQYEKIVATYTDIRDMVFRLYAEHGALVQHYKDHMVNGLLVIRSKKSKRAEARSKRARDRTYSQTKPTIRNYG